MIFYDVDIPNASSSIKTSSPAFPTAHFGGYTFCEENFYMIGS